MPRYVIERAVPGAGTLGAEELHDRLALRAEALVDAAQ